MVDIILPGMLPVARGHLAGRVPRMVVRPARLAVPPEPRLRWIGAGWSLVVARRVVREHGIVRRQGSQKPSPFPYQRIALPFIPLAGRGVGEYAFAHLGPLAGLLVSHTPPRRTWDRAVRHTMA